MRTSTGAMHKIPKRFFLLSPQELLGKCTLAEATFPLEPGTRPVDRIPYRANPRVQKTIDKCVNQMEKYGIIEQRPSPWDCAVTMSQNQTAPLGSA